MCRGQPTKKAGSGGGGGRVLKQLVSDGVNLSKSGCTNACYKIFKKKGYFILSFMQSYSNRIQE